jgi:two-component system, response regulator FlrC
MAFIEIGPPLATIVRHHILATLIECRGNRTRAAKVLQISVRCLRDKLRDYASEGVTVPPPAKETRESVTADHWPS